MPAKQPSPKTGQRNKPKLTAVDLFSGCGGLTEGLKLAGFSVVGAIELSELAAKTYSMNHPEVALVQQDIRRVDISSFRRSLGLEKGQLDLLAGCPPCQGFSTVRTLNGRRDVRDERDMLTEQFLQFVRGFLPKSVMLENVPGLANQQLFQDLRTALEIMGYRIQVDVLDAQDYGVPQRRRRLILIAARGRSVRFADKIEPRSTVASTIRLLPNPSQSADPLHRFVGKRSERILKLISKIPADGGSRSDIPRDYWLECHKKCNGFKDVYGRMRWDDVAPTITGGCLNPSKGRFLHPDQDRAITPREAALLQSFRPGYQFSLERGYYAVAEMIGNALPPRFVQAQASQLAAVLSSKRPSRRSAKSLPVLEK